MACNRSTDKEYSYDSIILKPGEKKITEEVDTREFPDTVDWKRVTLLNAYSRSPFRVDLHLSQGRSHPGQHAPLPSAEDRARTLRGLQGKLPIPAYLHYPN